MISDKKDDMQKEQLARIQNQLIQFETALGKGETRSQVQELVSILANVQRLGPSLSLFNNHSSAKSRMLAYFLKHPKTVIPRAELQAVAGITDWARRIRELRVEEGWPILSGITFGQMAKEDEIPNEFAEFERLKPDDYILLTKVRDDDAASRWEQKNTLRRKRIGVQEKLLVHS